MLRKHFTMRVYPEKIDEYIKRHNPIWEELAATLQAHGVHNYSIALDRKTNTLFGYAEVESEERWQAIANTEICQKWWKYMADMMETNPDDSPVSNDLEEVFYLP